MLVKKHSIIVNICYIFSVLHSSLVILSSRVFCCCGEREGKKSTPVTLSMSLTGVRENLSNLDTGEGSWTREDNKAIESDIKFSVLYPKLGRMLK